MILNDHHPLFVTKHLGQNESQNSFKHPELGRTLMCHWTRPEISKFFPPERLDGIGKQVRMEKAILSSIIKSSFQRA
jgi:hypothetical protein